MSRSLGDDLNVAHKGTAKVAGLKMRMAFNFCARAEQFNKLVLKLPTTYRVGLVVHCISPSARIDASHRGDKVPLNHHSALERVSF
jgi:hypothetical protein